MFSSCPGLKEDSSGAIWAPLRQRMMFTDTESLHSSAALMPNRPANLQGCPCYFMPALQTRIGCALSSNVLIRAHYPQPSPLPVDFTVYLALPYLGFRDLDRPGKFGCLFPRWQCVFICRAVRCAPFRRTLPIHQDNLRFPEKDLAIVPDERGSGTQGRVHTPRVAARARASSALPRRAPPAKKRLQSSTFLSSPPA